MTNTLIYSIPPVDRERPPLAAAILANVCKKQGHRCRVIDLQVELDKYLRQHNIDVDYFKDVFYEQTPSFSDDQVAVLKEFIHDHLQLFKAYTPDYVLLSFFSYLAQAFGLLFVEHLRAVTDAKIVIGGAGLARYSDLDLIPYPQSLKDNKLIDEYITGDAEESLVNYFATSSGPGIGNYNFAQIQDLDKCPWPDYSYFDLSNYDIKNKGLVIIGSRGCVRDCTFCNIRATSPKYKFRSGQNIADEIIHHYEMHGCTKYYFADSLVNGSFKAFDDMCNGLMRYNFAEPISWSGQYIIRSIKQTPKNHFELLKASGCETLFIGLESGSDRVRAELGKPFTNDDVEYYLENFSKFGIQLMFLMFSGYVSETDADHAETLSMFKRWQKYVATGTIQGIETLNILTILPGTHLERIAKENSFMFLLDERGKLNLRSWVNPARPDYDFSKRVQYHIDMIEEAIKYKWPLWNGVLSAQLYEQALENFIKTPIKQYIPITVLQQ